MTYDNSIGRFIAGEQDVDDSTHVSTFDIAVSKTSSPATLSTSDWSFYQINTTESGYDADYPGNVGYNHDAFVFTLNMYLPGEIQDHVQINSISASDLANGVSRSQLHTYQTDYNDFNLRPTTMHDSVAGDPMWLVTRGNGNDQINVYKMTNELSTSPSFTITTLTVTPYSPVVYPLNPNGTTVTNNIDSRIQKSAEANHTIVAAHAVSVSSTQDVIQWYKIDVSSGTPVLSDEGDVSAGNNTYLIYPAIDINPSGQIGLTYMKSGTDTTTDYLSMYVTGRNSSDPAGTMEASVLVPAGTGQATYYCYGNGKYRAGDLSGINVDPTDGSFWAANEFANSASTNNWSTAIANFSLQTSATSVSESFDELSSGQALPSSTWGTAVWPSGGPATFGAVAGYNGTMGYQVGDTNYGPLDAEVYYGTALASSNQQVSIDLDVLQQIPAQVIADASNLTGTLPSYYGFQMDRNGDVNLVKPVSTDQYGDVQYSTLAHLNIGYFEHWVQLTLTVTHSGSQAQLSGQVYRLDTNQYLTSSGTWQSAQATALSYTDSSGLTGSQVGFGRPGSFAGSVTFDNFNAAVVSGGGNQPLSGTIAASPSPAVSPSLSLDNFNSAGFSAAGNGTSPLSENLAIIAYLVGNPMIGKPLSNLNRGLGAESEAPPNVVGQLATRSVDSLSATQKANLLGISPEALSERSLVNPSSSDDFFAQFDPFMEGQAVFV